MGSIIRTFTNAVRQYRFGIFRLMLNRILPAQAGFHTFVLYDYDLKQTPSAEWQGREDVTFRRVVSETDEWFAAFRQVFPDPEFLSRVRSENKTCFLATKGDEIAGYAWVSFDDLYIESINSRYSLKPGELFIYACYVREEFRGQGIYPDMLRSILKEYHRREYRRACIGALSVNIGSIRGIRRSGFRKCREITYLRFLNLEKRWGLNPHRVAGSHPAAANSGTG